MKKTKRRNKSMAKPLYNIIFELINLVLFTSCVSSPIVTRIPKTQTTSILSTVTPTLIQSLMPTAPLTEQPYSHPDIRDISLVVNLVNNRDYYNGTVDECVKKVTKNQPTLLEKIPSHVGNSTAPIYLTIGVHVEILPYLRGRDNYLRDAAHLRLIADIITRHQGRMTIQVQRPFTTFAVQENDTILRDLSMQGHEIALHIHEDFLLPAFLGQEYPGVERGAEIAAAQSFDTWMAALGDLKTEVEELSGKPVRTFNGAPFFPDRYQAMALLGFEANYDGKDPTSKTISEKFLVVNPWRPAGSHSFEEMSTYDRNGAIVFIPSGIYPAHCTNVGWIPIPFSNQGFDYLTRALRASLAEADPNKINVFSAYFHPDDFGQSEDNKLAFGVWESWLTEIIDPLVTDGRVRWSTFLEIAHTYQEWEEVNVP